MSVSESRVTVRRKHTKKGAYAHVLYFKLFSQLFVKLFYAIVLLPSKFSKQFESFPLGRNLDLIKSRFLGLQGTISKESLHKASAHPKI